MPHRHPDIAEEIQRLADLVERHPNGPFSEEETEQLRRVAMMVGRLDAMGWFGKRLLWLVLGVAGLIVEWERVRNFMGWGQ